MKSTREVKIGNISIGAGNPVAIQSMLNTDPHDCQACVDQAIALEKAGCEIVRTAVPDMASVAVISALKENVSIPVVADIHFDYRIALACAEAGVDKIRINPGNIGDDTRVKTVVDACKAKSIPIRIPCSAPLSPPKNLSANTADTIAAAIYNNTKSAVAIFEPFLRS